jgi:heat shock protein HslJ
VWYTRRVRTTRWIGAGAVVLAAALVGTACAPPKDEVRVIDQASSAVQAVNDKTVEQAAALNDPNSPLTGEWRLEPGSVTVPIPDGAQPTLTIGNGTVSGFGGCTTYSAGAAIVADQLLLETIGQGDASACTPEALALEEAYLGALADVGGYRFEGDRLVLADVGGRPILAFTR